MKRVLFYLLGAIIYGVATGLYAYHYGRALPKWIMILAVLAWGAVVEYVLHRDKVKLRASEEKLRASERKFENIYEQMLQEAVDRTAACKYREAIVIYSKFIEEYPLIHEQEIIEKISALKSLIHKEENLKEKGESPNANKKGDRK
jgi:hypothetical protein